MKTKGCLVALTLTLTGIVGCGQIANLGGSSGADGGLDAARNAAGTGGDRAFDGGAKSGAGGASDGVGGAGGTVGTGGTIATDRGAGGASVGAGGNENGAGGAEPDAGGGRAGTGGTTSGAGGIVSAGGARTDAGAPSCDDNVKDGDETDVDCGGSCPGCAARQRCAVDEDCSDVASGCDVALGGCACDAVSRTCAPSHCNDRKQDVDETDVDCGGSCPGCGQSKTCAHDSDCSKTLPGCTFSNSGCTCDVNTFTCVYDHCYDHKLDFSETDEDCGGGECAKCATGKKCSVNDDCLSGACDGVSKICVTSSCGDHRVDYAESDTDCGGPVCQACLSGEKCATSFDCQAGHPCNTSHVCQ